MFILESELEAAAELFAVKFSDIAQRHRVLYGELPTALQAISPVARRRQLREILMNLTLRLRRAYVITSLREEQLATIIAETAGSLRTAASTLLELEGQPPASPRESLIRLVRALDDQEGEKWDDMLARISEARETGCLPAGVAVPVLSRIMSLLEIMRQRADKTA
jgi:hypothetical protein